MENIREIIAENLTLLRKQKQLTQAEIAEKFNYSDKAVSKWEKGDTMPDIETLSALADFYGVTLDFLTHSGNKEEKAQYIKENKSKKHSKIASCALLCSGAWIIATVIFVYCVLKFNLYQSWVAFVWAIPVTCVVIWFFNRFTFHRLITTVIITSIFLWSCIAGVYLTTAVIRNTWDMFLLFVVGVPIQIALYFYYNIKK